MYKYDDHGRITDLIVGGDLCGNDDDNCNIEPYDLPPIIGHLEGLNDLGVIGDCRSLPAKELYKLAHLQNLRLNGSTNLLRNFPVEMKLRHLTFIDIRCSQFQFSGHFFKWMIRQLPTLESLEFYMIEKDQTDIFLEFLRTLDPVFKSKLKCLDMHMCKIDENRLKILMFEIVPKFEDLAVLLLYDNEIESIENLVDSMENYSPHSISKSIRRLDLTDNPIFLSRGTNSISEQKAILSLLNTYKSVCSLGYISNDDLIDPGIQYAMMINQVGRSIVEDNRDLPLSVWPTLLERADEKSGDYFGHWEKRENTRAGLYYLVRNAPKSIFTRRATDSDDNNTVTTTTTIDNSINPLKRKLAETEGLVDSMSSR
jgi:hypothetical protein